MIGIVKNCLKKTLHKTKLTTEELRTVIVEIESRVNNRPLTYLDDSTVNLEALTPSHLIHGRRIDPLPCIDVQDELNDPTVDDSAQHLRQSYHTLNKILKGWDRHWSTDYLLSLRERFYGAQPAENKVLLKVGDIVLLKGDQPRSQWPLTKVISVHPDKDGVVRIVKVLTKGQTSLRTVDKLIPLELAELPSQKSGEAPQQSQPQRERQLRASAQKSQDTWRNLISSGHIT